MDLTEAMDLASEGLTRSDLREELEAFAKQALRNELRAFANQVKRNLHDELLDLVQSLPEKPAPVHPMAATERVPSKPTSPNGTHAKASTMRATLTPPGGTSVGAVPGQSPRDRSVCVANGQQVYYSEPGQSGSEAGSPIGRHHQSAVFTSEYISEESVSVRQSTSGSLAGISRFDDDDEEGFGVGLRGYVVTAEMNFLHEQETKRNSLTIARQSEIWHSSKSSQKSSVGKLRSTRTTSQADSLAGSRKTAKFRSFSTATDWRAGRGLTSVRSDASIDEQACALGAASMPPLQHARLHHQASVGDATWAMPRPPSFTEPPPPPDESALAPLPGFSISHNRRESESKSSCDSQPSVDHPGMVTEPDAPADAEYVTWRSSLSSEQSANTYNSYADSGHRHSHSSLRGSTKQSQNHGEHPSQLEPHQAKMGIQASLDAPAVDTIDDSDQDSAEQEPWTSKRSLVKRLSRMRKVSCAYRTADSLLNNPFFDYITTMLILINAVTIGVQADWAARHVKEDTPRIFGILESFFCVCFTLELIVRIFVYRWSFFTMATWKWNVFDGLVVGVQIIEEAFALIWRVTLDSGDNGLPTNIAALRVMRILRVIRIVRLVRVLRLINELRTLVHSIVGTMKSLMWTCVLIFLMVYIIGVYLTQVVTDARVDLEERPSGDANTDNQNEHRYHQAFNIYYGTLSRSLLSLYQSISGGVDWAEMVTPLTDHIHPLLGLFFSAYIAFMMLAVFNVVTGVFVETALVSAKEDKDVYMVNTLRNIFMSSDVNEDGTIDWQEFQAQLEKSAMREYFKAIDVDISEARGVFRLLDPHDSGNIHAEEFLSGCLRLKGPAKSLDMNILLRETQRISQMYKAHARWVERHLSQLKEVVPAVKSLQTIMSTQLETLRAAQDVNALDGTKEEWLV